MKNVFKSLLFTVAGVSAAALVQNSQAATLVAHYTFDDPSNLGLDSSGMGNDAVVSNVNAVAGVSGGGGFFDEGAGSSFVQSGGLTGYTSKPGYSLSAWVNLDAATAGFDGIVSQDGGSCCQHRILIHSDNNLYINSSEHSDRHLSGGPALVLGEWTHVAMTGMDISDTESETRIYIDGVEVGDSPQIFPALDDGSTWNTYLGAGEAGTAHLLTGALDDVRVYEGALTASEVRTLANIPEPSVVGLCFIGLASLVLSRSRQR